MERILPYYKDIFERTKEFKGFKYIDPQFEKDIQSLFDNVSTENHKKLYNGIVVFSITCKMEKNLQAFQIPLDLLPVNSKAYEIAIDINRKTLNNLYKFE